MMEEVITPHTNNVVTSCNQKNIISFFFGGQDIAPTSHHDKDY